MRCTARGACVRLCCAVLRGCSGVSALIVRLLPGTKVRSRLCRAAPGLSERPPGTYVQPGMLRHRPGLLLFASRLQCTSASSALSIHWPSQTWHKSAVMASICSWCLLCVKLAPKRCSGSAPGWLMRPRGVLVQQLHGSYFACTGQTLKSLFQPTGELLGVARKILHSRHVPAGAARCTRYRPHNSSSQCSTKKLN